METRFQRIAREQRERQEARAETRHEAHMAEQKRQRVRFYKGVHSMRRAEELAIAASRETPTIEVVLGYRELTRVYLDGKVVRE